MGNSRKVQSEVSKILSKIPKSEELLNLLLESLKEEHALVKQHLQKDEQSIPDYIFTNKLTVLESIVKYLKENLSLSFREISKIISRDERNIWHIYDSTKQKLPSSFIIKETKLTIPLSILSNKKLSVLENITTYLKDSLKLSYHEIALLLHRDDRTIWTVYQRARKKYGK